MSCLTAAQLRELEGLTQGSTLQQQLLTEFKAQRAALISLQQYVEMFADAEGTLDNVNELLTDLKEILDGVGSEGYLTSRT
jgi:hypothetical protein